MGPGILLAMQAAGMVTNMLGRHYQDQLSQIGAQLDQANIQNQILSTRLQTTQSAIVSMQNLRRTMATQNAIFAARGTAPGVGSALAISEDSQSAYGQDRQTQILNQYAKETALKSRQASSALGELATQQKLANKNREELSKLAMDTGSYFDDKYASPNFPKQAGDWLATVGD